MSAFGEAGIQIRLAVVLGAMGLLCACLLGGRPEAPRYFRPGPPARVESALDGAPGAGSTAPALRLHRVTSAAHLKERIVWRTSDVEFGFYDTRRWTELPAHYVEQRLSRQLFEVRGLRRATAGRAPLLEVELLAFEEVLTPRHQARLELRVLLFDRKGIARLERTFTTVEPIPGDDPVSVSRAIGRALNVLVGRVSDVIESELRSD
ncbi:MAG: hypothetical protein E2O71_04735 [Deltaproteobacteria bacterium]|nr:MAG: hypothetical protein E2O71_04735 [Deltaproteobacteria bacterium]